MWSEHHTQKWQSASSTHVLCTYAVHMSSVRTQYTCPLYACIHDNAQCNTFGRIREMEENREISKDPKSHGACYYMFKEA